MTGQRVANLQIPSTLAQRHASAALDRAQAASGRRDRLGAYQELGTAVALLDRARGAGLYALIQGMLSRPSAAAQILRLEPSLGRLRPSAWAAELGVLLGASQALPVLRSRARALAGSADELATYQQSAFLEAKLARADQQYGDVFEHLGTAARLRPVQMLVAEQGTAADFLELLQQLTDLSSLIERTYTAVVGEDRPALLASADQSAEQMVHRLSADPVLATQVSALQHLAAAEALFTVGKMAEATARLDVAVEKWRAASRLTDQRLVWAGFQHSWDASRGVSEDHGAYHPLSDSESLRAASQAWVDQRMGAGVDQLRAESPAAADELELAMLLRRLEQSRARTEAAIIGNIQPR
jgi:hypothetical protein